MQTSICTVEFIHSQMICYDLKKLKYKVGHTSYMTVMTTPYTPVLHFKDTVHFVTRKESHVTTTCFLPLFRLSLLWWTPTMGLVYSYPVPRALYMCLSCRWSRSFSPVARSHSLLCLDNLPSPPVWLWPPAAALSFPYVAQALASAAPSPHGPAQSGAAMADSCVPLFTKCCDSGYVYPQSPSSSASGSLAVSASQQQQNWHLA